MPASRASRGKAAKRKPTKATKKPGSVSFLSTNSQPLVMVALVVVVFVVFANSFGNEFVFDDIYLVSGNKMLRSLDLPLLLSSYRPLRDISYALDFAFWGETPFGFHFTNVLIHAANVLLVFTLVRRLTKDIVSATLAALIFAVHPIQTDAVTYISGRRDVLFSTFYLLAFHSYLNYYRQRWSGRSVVYFVAFLVCWILSLLSKEMAVSLPLFIFVWQFCDAWEEGGAPPWRQLLPTVWRAINREKILAIVLSVGGVAFTFYWVYYKGASRLVRTDRFEYWGGSFYTNMLTVVRVHAWYLKQLIYPTPIAQYLNAFEPSQTALDWRFLLSAVVVGGVLVLGFFLLNRNKLMAFAIFSYFVMLLPVSQIIPHHELLADHYLYLPMMSFGLFISLLAKQLADTALVTRKTVYVVAAALVLILAVSTVIQNTTWKNERTLWTANYKAVPNSPRAALNLGNTYQYTDPLRAAELFKRALELKPTTSMRNTLNDRLAVILINEKKFDEAEFYVNEVLKTSPNDFFGNLWSSQIFMFRKECDRAGLVLSRARAVAGNPRQAQLAEQARVQFQEQCGSAS